MVTAMKLEKKTHSLCDVDIPALNGIASSRTTFIFDDLDVSKMSDDEQAVVGKMLKELDQSLRISSALAGSILDPSKAALS